MEIHHYCYRIADNILFRMRGGSNSFWCLWY